MYADPLFFDEYAGCWATPNPQINPNSHHYCVVTKFLDDNLIQKVNNVNGFKQVLANKYYKNVKICFKLNNSKFLTSLMCVGCVANRWNGY